MDTEKLALNTLKRLSNDLPNKTGITSVVKLSGGLINYVYRLEFEDKSTAILKHYSSLMSSDNNVEISQKRYHAEKAALELINKNIFFKENFSFIKVPKLLYFNDDLYFILMEDAGKTSISLFDFLKSDNKIELDRINKLIHIFSKELVSFLKFLTEKSKITPRTHKKEFENESVWNMINNYVCELCLNQAKLYNLQNELKPYLEFMEKRYKPVSDDEGVFVLGDLWPNSILIDTDKELFWIIDWEMSRFETKTSDIEQLMSNLWLMKQNSNIFNTNSTQTLIHRVQYEYFGNENNDWRTHCSRDASKSFVLWILSLLNEPHWQITNSLDVITKALKEAEALDQQN